MPAAPTLLHRASPAVAAVVSVASRLRGERVVHGRGRTLAGRLVVPGGEATGAALLDTPGEYDVLLRFSRSAGLPAPLPDVHGLAVRVVDAYGPDRHQDLLLDSTLSPPLLRRLPVPMLRPRLFGSLLPYDVGGVRCLLGARWSGDDLELLVSSTHGHWRPFGVVHVGDPVAEGRRIRFNVGTTGGGIEPVGVLQEWRRRSYDAARVGPDA